MYKVFRFTDIKHGAVISIEPDINSQLTPFLAVQAARKEQRLWIAEGEKKVRVLIDGQAMSANQAEQWASEEYDELPKCSECAKILGEELFLHNLCPDFFCSQICADINYNEYLEKLKDEYEHEVDL